MSTADDLEEHSTIFSNTSAAKELIYKSASIFERRRRILREARSLISERGYENFNVRELARRAKVAQRTLYNAFGSRENIVINAIYQYQSDFTEHVHFDSSPLTLLGRIERTVKVHSRNLQIRPYTSAVMAIYNSPSSDLSIRQAIIRLSNNGIKPFAEHLAAKQQLARGVTPASYSLVLTRFSYATLSAWCLGEIPDGDMVESMAESLLTTTEASTKGVTKREASDWLQEVRERSPRWKELKLRVEVPPVRRRGAGAGSKAAQGGG